MLKNCRNLGALDRALRIAVGADLLAIVFVGPETPWGWLGLVPLISGAAGACPLYRLFGLRSCPVSPRPAG